MIIILLHYQNDLAPIADSSDIQAGLIMVEDMRKILLIATYAMIISSPLKKEK